MRTFWEMKKQGLTPFKEYGLRLYSGAQGGGKTMSLVHQLEEYRLNYPNLFIATNFHYKHENVGLTSLAEIPALAKQVRKSGYIGLVIGWDEIQNDFDNQTRAFPISILRTITQQRKQGIKILATSQVFTRVAKPIREQTFEVVSCKTLLGRWTFQKWYDPVEFEYYIQNPDKQDKMGCIRRLSFIQTDLLRELFDSYAVIDNLETSIADEQAEKVIQAVFTQPKQPAKKKKRKKRSTANG